MEGLFTVLIGLVIVAGILALYFRYQDRSHK
jgi:uncharacterized membrane protein